MNRDDVINKIFPHSFFGYDPVAVDAFLDEVIREFDRLNNTIDVLKLRLSQELGEAQEINKVLSGVLLKEGFIKRASALAAADGSAPAEEPAAEERETAEEPAAEERETAEEPVTVEAPKEPAEEAKPGD